MPKVLRELGGVVAWYRGLRQGEDDTKLFFHTPSAI